jgi:hypothetical protein
LMSFRKDVCSRWPIADESADFRKGVRFPSEELGEK